MMSVEAIAAEIQKHRRPTQHIKTLAVAQRLIASGLWQCWPDYLKRLDELKFLSCGVSQTGNTYEVRVRAPGRVVLRIQSYHAANGSIVCEIMDQLYEKLVQKDFTLLFERISSEVRPMGEYPSGRDFGSVVLGPLLLANPQALFCIQTLADELQDFYAKGTGVERNRRHERTKAIEGMRPFVKRFLQYGGSYEEMVTLLNTEVVSSIQDT